MSIELAAINSLSSLDPSDMAILLPTNAPRICVASIETATGKITKELAVKIITEIRFIAKMRGLLAATDLSRLRPCNWLNT